MAVKSFLYIPDTLCPGVCPRCLVRLHFANPTSVPSCPPEQPRCLDKSLLLPQNLDLSLLGSAQQLATISTVGTLFSSDPCCM